MKLSFDIENVATLIITTELFMYGVVFLRIDQGSDGLVVNYMAVADGGEVCGQKREVLPGKNLQNIIANIMAMEFPEYEDDEMAVRWGVQIGDKDSKLISEIEQGYWDIKSIMYIVDILDEKIGTCEALSYLRTLLEE